MAQAAERENDVGRSGIRNDLTSAVGYEVYMRSFADADGDGVGDFRGITERLDHLAWLGIDILWLTPFFSSPMADFGYDVADYRDTDELFGTLDDLDRLVERAHELGLRVIADLVPNHSSDAHAWFVEARQSRDNPHREYYIWRDPAADGGPPNNWLSHFGGPAWTLDEPTGQYYCHLFLPEQPDMNWRNPAVHEEFESILRFWFERGLDGFRIDVAQSLYKDEQLRDNPRNRPLEEAVGARSQFLSLDHLYDLQQPETLDVFRRWREVADDYGTMLVGETYVYTAEELAALVPGDGLDVGFWFLPMHIAWAADEIRNVLRGPVDQVEGGIGWVLSSHDASRPVARFGGGDVGRMRSLGLSTLMFGLPGMPFLYQGEELGLDDAQLTADQLADPLAVRNENTAGRDVCRTPMPWEPGVNLGFSTAEKTWLPVSHEERDTVAAQRDDPEAHLHRVRRLIQLRHELDLPSDVPVQWLTEEGGVKGEIVGFWRGDVLFALNVGSAPATVDPGGLVEVLFRTSVAPGAGATPPVSAVELAPNSAAVARRVDG